MSRASNLSTVIVAGIMAIHLAVGIAGERFEQHRKHRREMESLKVRLTLAWLLLAMATAIGTMGWIR